MSQKGVICRDTNHACAMFGSKGGGITGVDDVLDVVDFGSELLRLWLWLKTGMPVMGCGDVSTRDSGVTFLARSTRCRGEICEGVNASRGLLDGVGSILLALWLPVGVPV